MKFKTFGCGAAVATSSMATELLERKEYSGSDAGTNKAVMEALDGLPPVKAHCSLLAEEAIHARSGIMREKHRDYDRGAGETEIRYSVRMKKRKKRNIDEESSGRNVRRRGFFGCGISSEKSRGYEVIGVTMQILAG